MNTKKHDVPEELLASLLADYKKARKTLIMRMVCSSN